MSSAAPTAGNALASAAPGEEQNSVAAYGADTFDWDVYDRYRPRYPAELYDLLFSFHAQHGGQWKVACDFGCGTGTVEPALLSRFEEVRASDLNTGQLAILRQRFAAEIEQGRVKAIADGAGKEPCDWIEDGEADMFIAAEAIHWFNRPAWFAQATRKLKKGGTLAFWHYSICPSLVTDDEKVRTAFLELFEYGTASMMEKSEQSDSMLHVVAHDLTTMSTFTGPPASDFYEERHTFELAPSVVNLTEIFYSGRVERWRARVPEAFALKLPPAGQVHTHAAPSAADGALLNAKAWTAVDLVQYIISLGAFDARADDPGMLERKAALEAALGGADRTVTVAWRSSMALCSRL